MAIALLSYDTEGEIKKDIVFSGRTEPSFSVILKWYAGGEINYDRKFSGKKEPSFSIILKH